MGGQKFTRISDNGKKGSRLDRFLTSNGFCMSWRNLGVKALDRKWSDHYPIMLHESNGGFGPKPFKIFDTWLEEEGWKGQKEKFGKLEGDAENFKEMTKKLEGILEHRSFDGEERKRWIEAQNNWLTAEKRKAEIAWQKAKVKWVKDGDENSRFFHAVIRKKERKNGIRGLEVNSHWTEDPEKIKEGVFEFFKRKFMSRKTEGPKLKSGKMNKISREEAEYLERRFTEVEIWEAIKACGSNKSPGPDGITIAFIKKFWLLIKEDLVKALDNFWEKAEISRGCNASFLTLIPKKQNPIGLNEYRPISLIGILYKILSKVLSERMKKVLGGIIGDTQTTFIKGRLVLDGVLIANEVVEYTRKAKKKALVFKVDFDKAYDSVEWEFLLHAMSEMGFGTKWCKWVKACLISSTISVLVNGSPTKEFTMEKGIRQGDPLAPFLFLIVAESLNTLMKEAKAEGIFEGIKVGKEGMEISHLQYADDAIFFGKWNIRNLKNLMKILKCFYEASGLKINISKSKLYGIGVEEEETQAWAHGIGCVHGVLPFMYLGLPVGVVMSKSDSWKMVVEKIKNKLATWKARLISFGGRQTLVKFVLGSLSLYFFSLFRAPSGVIKELERVRSSFFWGGGNGYCAKGWLGSNGLMLGTKNEATIRERGEWVEGKWVWKWAWRREPMGREKGELEALIGLVGEWAPKPSSKDRYIWMGGEKDEFTVCDIKKLIEEGVVADGDHVKETKWLKEVPKKVNIFMWRARLGRLPCKEVLDKIGMDLPSILCPRCQKMVETVNHALVECEEVAKIWEGVTRWWKVHSETTGSFNGLVESNATPRLWKEMASRTKDGMECLAFRPSFDDVKKTYRQSGQQIVAAAKREFVDTVVIGSRLVRVCV
ncbi:hypothetical protein L6452_03008 [Arctium lappa]|uniref:Uncharacterized protein n=1 Tax=Arctium lappa TaxID=4217 RepID=A0ACB9FKN9_ARCLA|nr:hypothetical protein L6452_03008 [Arctium lappa]